MIDLTGEKMFKDVSDVPRWSQRGERSTCTAPFFTYYTPYTTLNTRFILHMNHGIKSTKMAHSAIGHFPFSLEYLLHAITFCNINICLLIHLLVLVIAK